MRSILVADGSTPWARLWPKLFPASQQGFGPAGLIEEPEAGPRCPDPASFGVQANCGRVRHALGRPRAAASPGWFPASSSGPRSGPPADSLARPTAARRWAKRVAPPRLPRRPVLKGLNVCDDRRDRRPDNQNPNRNRDGRGDQRHRVQFHFYDSPPQYGSWPYSGQCNPTAAIASAAIAAASTGELGVYLPRLPVPAGR